MSGPIIMPNGKVAVDGDGKPKIMTAAEWAACCCAEMETCGACLDNTAPPTVTVTLDGFENNHASCTGCADINGEFILSDISASELSCSWVYYISNGVCFVSGVSRGFDIWATIRTVNNDFTPQLNVIIMVTVFYPAFDPTFRTRYDFQYNIESKIDCSTLDSLSIPLSSIYYPSGSVPFCGTSPTASISS